MTPLCIQSLRRTRDASVRALMRTGLAAATLATATALTLGSAVAPAAAATGDVGSTASWSLVFDQLRPAPTWDPHRVIVTFDEPSLAAWQAAGTVPLGAKAELAFLKDERAHQDVILARFRAAGIQYRLRHRYTKTLSGVSLELQASSDQQVAVIDGVTGVWPVVTVWPAAVASTPVSSASTAAKDARDTVDTAAAAPTSSKVPQVAVLDTGIDTAHPLLAGSLGGPGFDATREQVGVDAGADDAHGTEVASALRVAAGGNVGLVPIRVLDRQPVIGGIEATVGHSDDLLAGIERSVDPNGDGLVSDHVDVALAAVVEPYASFAGSPEEQAVAGASTLGTVVVAATGNDGPGSGATTGDPGAGTVGAPAAARDALAVGAADLRAQVSVVDFHVDAGVVDAGVSGAPLLTVGTTMPSGALDVVSVAGAATDASDYLDADAVSRVDGRVALVDAARSTPVSDQVRAAADAGAVAVFVAGADDPSTAGVIDELGADVPAIGISREQADVLRDADRPRVKLTLRAGAANPLDGSVAGFSSSGPRFDGLARPDVLGPGVGVLAATSPPPWGDGAVSAGGTTQPRYARVTGTSIAAAVVAGTTARLRSVHPDWTAAHVRAAIIDTATPVTAAGSARVPVSRQGGGIAAPAAAEAATLVAEPARIDGGIVAPGDTARIALQFIDPSTGVVPSTAPALLSDTSDADGPQPVLVDGRSLELRVPKDAASGTYGGWLVAADGNLRVPWSITVARAGELDVPVEATLDHPTLSPATGPEQFPDTLHVRIGTDRGSLRAASRVRVTLIDPQGHARGIVADLRDVLPGDVALGVTGDLPSGKAMPAGTYTLRVIATSAASVTGEAQPAVDVPLVIAAPA